MVKGDLRTLVIELGNNFVRHFMGGKSITVIDDAFISSLQTVVSAETQVNVSRSLSKMISVFTSLDKAFTFTRSNYS